MPFQYQAECVFCHTKGLDWRWSNIKGKNMLWNPNTEQPHECIKNPTVVNQSIDEWREKMRKGMAFEVRVWCSECDMGFLPRAVCGHLLKKGFKEGEYTSAFFADSFEAKQARLDHRMEQMKNPHLIDKMQYKLELFRE